MFDQILIRPVLDMDVDPESVSFTVNEKPVSLKDGVLCAGGDGWWKTGDRVIVSAEYTADGVTYMGRTGYDLITQTQTVELNMKKGVEVTVSLSDNGDPMKGAERYFAVYNSNQELITIFSTYHPSSTVTLVEGERYTILADWNRSSVQETNAWYNLTSYAARATIIAEEGCEIALNKSYFFAYGLSRFFTRENGISSYAVSLLANGDAWVTLYLTAGWISDPQISYVYNMVTLPEGSRDISCTADYTFDEETGLMTLSDNLAEKLWLAFETIQFRIPAKKIPTEFLLQSLTRYSYDGVEHIRVNNELELANELMYVNVPGRISASALQSTGLPLDIRLPYAQSNGKLEVYAEDTLLTVVAAGQHNRVVVHPENRLGECTLRVVYTAENGFTLSRAVTCEITADARPVLQSARVQMGNRDLGDLVNPQKQLYYNAGSLGALTCQATFSHPELVERVWLCGKTASEFDRFELFWSEEENAFIGEGQIGTLMKPFTALWIEFDEKPRSIEDIANDVMGEVTVDYELTYTPEEISDNPYSYAPDPDLGEAVQEQAISDWKKYMELVRGGLYEMDEEDTIAALNELFGEDGVWELPAVTDGENHFSMNYGYDPDTVAAKLSSAEAFTVIVNGEERKVLIEFEEEDGDLYICYYGLGDLFIPAVAEEDEAVMTAAGSLIGGVGRLVKRHWKDGMKVRQKYNEYKWIGEGLKEELNKDPEDPGANDSGDPCGGSGAGGQTREDRRQQINEMFDEGWEAAKAVGSGISKAGGAMGLGTTMFGSHLTKDGSVMHAMFEMQKQRIHQIDDALDEADEDAFADGSEDPCENENPEKDKGTDRGRSKNGYQFVYPLVDPSGYLYAGAPGYPIEGVKAYLYYLEEDGETWTLWNSEDFGQGPNPYPSEENGYYGWDVLPGKWKVVFEGEGYARAESIVLDVPPPHLDVDIAMTSTRNPQISDVVVKADGSIYIKFDHPMMTQSVLHNAITITLGSEVLTGTLVAVNPTVTALGIKQAALSTNIQAGLEVASVFRFVPDDVLLAGMTVEVTVDGSVLGYNGLPMLSGWSDRLTVPARDADLTLTGVERIREDEIYLEIGDSYTLNAGDWYALFSDGFGLNEKRTNIDIRWYSNNELVATVDETGKITAVGGGIASIIGEYDGHTIAFGVSVTRAPILADAAENDVKFCRDLNLVLGKACYMWSSAANFRLDDPMEGDEKYMPTAWRIKEAGVVMAEGTLADGETSLKIIYTPTVLGTLVGEIDYQKYVYTGGRWVASGSPETAVRNIPVTEVTGLTLYTAPKIAKPGEALDLSAMRIGIALSDDSVSVVGYEKLASYGISMNLNHGDTLGESDTVLILTHARTGITLMIELQTGDADRVHICNDHLTPIAESGATCTEDGYKAHYKCTCGKYFEDATASVEIPDIDAWKASDGKIAKKGHNYTEQIMDTAHLKAAATKCTEYNIYWYACSVCGANAKDDPNAADKFYTSTEAGDHSFSEKLEDAAHLVEGTGTDCQSAKKYYYDCAYCDEIGTTSWTSTTFGAHSFTEQIADDAHFVAGTGANCQDAKEYYYDCALCAEIGTISWVSTEMGDHEFDTTQWGYAEKETGHAHKCKYCTEHDTVQPHTPGAPATEDEDQICTVCLIVLTPKVGHIHQNNLTPVAESGATCTEDGYKAHYKCTCGKYFEDASASVEIPDIDAWKAGDGKIAKKGHNYTEQITDTAHLKTAATKCTEYNIYWYACSVCGANAKDDPNAADKFYTSTEAGDHSFSEKLEDAAHLVAGTGTNCQDAKEFYYDCAYCTEIGTNTWVSTTFGAHSFTEQIADDAHFVAGTGANCQDAKEYYYDCALCAEIGTISWVSTEMGDHEFDTTQWGYAEKETGHAHKCKYCTEHDTVQPHTPGAPATEDEDQICTVCLIVLEPAAGHICNNHLTKVPAEGASCTVDGNIEYYTCSCGKWYSDATASVEITDKESVKLPAGHNYGTLKPAQPEIHTATELKAGVAAHYYCDKCDTYFTEGKVATTLAALTGETPSHNYATQYGYKEADGHADTCSCGAKNTVVAHTPDRAEATETDAVKCSACGYVITPALGHIHMNNLTKVGAQSADCENDGNIEYYTCSCGKWFEDASASVEITDKDSVKIKGGHNYGTEWKYDEDSCWNECVCGDKANVTKHADENNDGKCDTCAYPVSKPSDSPQTGDNSNMVLWFSLLMLSALGVVATIIIGKKRYSVK